MKNSVNFIDDNKKNKINFSIDWNWLFKVTIFVCILVLVVFVILYCNYRFDLNNYYIKNF